MMEDSTLHAVPVKTLSDRLSEVVFRFILNAPGIRRGNFHPKRANPRTKQGRNLRMHRVSFLLPFDLRSRVCTLAVTNETLGSLITVIFPSVYMREERHRHQRSPPLRSFFSFACRSATFISLRSVSLR